MIIDAFRQSVKYSFIPFILFLAFHSAGAQVYREQFGKNRIQYKRFDWQYFYSDNFEVYFYKDGQELAKQSITYLEEVFDRITETIGYPPYYKMRVFLYNSPSDKLQSNVGVRGKDFTVGGETNFVKPQVEIAYPGSYGELKDVLVYNVTSVLIQEMLYGGNIAEMFQNTFTSPIPLWYTTGAAAYIARGWNKEMDDAAREYVSKNMDNKFSKLSDEKATLIGQSIWNFIAQKYGQRSVSNVLNLGRILRNEENSISRTLGIPFKTFMNEWRVYYSNMNTDLLESYANLGEDGKISGKNRQSALFTDVKISPNGTFLAYAALRSGRYDVNVIDLASGKQKTIYSGGIRLIDQETSKTIPILSWADNNTLGIVGNELGNNVLVIKRVGVKGQQRIVIPRLNQIKSFDFKYRGRVAVISGDIKGQNDLYVYNVNRNSLRKITNDSFDDLDASFVPGTNTIVFSSNRQNDSVYVKGPTQLDDADQTKFNLYTYDLDTTDSIFGKITNALASDVKAIAEDSETIYYLSDQQGVNNIYKHDRSISVSNQLTNYVYGIKSFDIDFEKGYVAYITIDQSRDAIYYVKLDRDGHRFTPPTPRRTYETMLLLAEMRKRRLMVDSVALPNEALQVIDKEEDVFPEEDTLKSGAIDTDNYQFESESKVDTKDYRFEKPSVADEEGKGRSFLSIYQGGNSQNVIEGPVTYETRFMTSNLVTTFVIDELRSVSQLMEIQMNDFLENHRFYGGLLIPFNFNSGYDVFGEYQFLKYKLDIKAKYFRKSIQRDVDGLRQRYNLNRFELGAAYPFTPNLRWEVTPFYTRTAYYDLNNLSLLSGQSIDLTESKANYVGINTGLIYDNSVVAGTNLHEGTRFKLVYENHFGLNSDAASFGNLELDVRHYQRLTRGIYLAARGFFGSYHGKGAKQYLLGGVDNWAFNETESTGDESDPLFFEESFDNSDILFHQFANLRGYSYNTFQGKNVLSFSAEIRFPIYQLLNTQEIRSNFLKNLQFTGFYEVGSAWNDQSPFSEKNNLNTEIIEINQFSAEINNFNNPWLQSVGGGMRTMLFGFFSRFDLAWPIRNFDVLSPKFQVSIGYDF